jgi:hypothetical protein
MILSSDSPTLTPRTRGTLSHQHHLSGARGKARRGEAALLECFWWWRHPGVEGNVGVFPSGVLCQLQFPASCPSSPAQFRLNCWQSGVWRLSASRLIARLTVLRTGACGPLACACRQVAHLSCPFNKSPHHQHASWPYAPRLPPRPAHVDSKGCLNEILSPSTAARRCSLASCPSDCCRWMSSRRQIC